MAVVSTSSPETLDPKPDKPDAPENPNPNPDPAPPVAAAATSPAPSPAPAENPNPDPPQNPNPSPVAPPPLSLPSFVPSFRPLGMPLAPQYSTIPNPNPGIVYYQNPSPATGGILPPGVPVTVSMPPPMRQMYPPMPYSHVPNGYMTGPPGVPPPGIPRYPGPYPNMVRPGFPPRPLPPMGVIPQIPRPHIPGIRGIHPAVTPLVRPVVPIIAPMEKPQTTVYVGKIAPSVDNDFLLSLLRLCGPVKSWKRAQDPTDGTPKGFGFCEFEAAEGILRALRLLTKLSIDGQELVLNINQATREYLERYVEKKTEREKLKETEGKAVEKEGEIVPGVEKQDHPKSTEDQKKEVDSGDKEDNQKFGIVTEEDRGLDRDALEKLTSMIEERIKNRPLPPPPPIQNHADTSAKSNSEILPKSREGDSDVDIMRSGAVEDKNDDETTSEAKTATENDKTEASSPDRGRRHDRRSRERDRERDLKWEKERELERYEREREREKVRREKERDMRMIEADRLFRDRMKEWEDRERDKERRRRDEKEREKERQRKRKNEILKDEDGSDDDDYYDDETRKRRRRSSMLEEKRRKRQHEKDDDLADRLKEEEEIAEAKRRPIEEKKQEELKPPPTLVTEENENVMMQEDGLISEDMEMAPSELACEVVSGNDTGDEVYINSSGGELSMGPAPLQDTKQNNDAPTKKLGFGLVGSGKRTTVTSVFHEEDDENVDDKKMRPLVPIDYSTEELQAFPTTVSSAPPNLVAAAEFAKRISGTNPKEEKLEMERERNGRSGDRTGHRERDRRDDENTRYRNESKEKIHDRSSERERERDRERDRGRERERERDRDREEKPKTENKKLLDAKQLIDMIPKTKEELFGYDINWVVYDKHELHERMRPWISKKITEFLGEEEATLVDYIVSSTKEHVQASKMLELLQSILDDEAELFVLKMWRMLIFEIKKVEAGLSAKPRA